MAATVPLDLMTLASVHPSYLHIRDKVAIPSFVKETCCVQMSHALNYGGGMIAHYTYPDSAYKDLTLAEHHVRAFKDMKSGLNYIYAVPDMRVYLDNVYGVAENFKGSEAEMKQQIAGRKGILALGHRHIDLWDGNRYQWQGMYINLWQHKSTKKRGIFFWQITANPGF